MKPARRDTLQNSTIAFTKSKNGGILKVGDPVLTDVVQATMRPHTNACLIAGSAGRLIGFVKEKCGVVEMKTRCSTGYQLPIQP